MRRIYFFCGILLLAGCGGDPVEESITPVFDIDVSRISVSGISSGAYMAGQLHVAHSALFNGAALLAGGPYRCAQASIQKALGSCIKGGDVDQPALLEQARSLAAAGEIDQLENLADDGVWLFHGANDDIVSFDATRAAEAFYANFIESALIEVVSDIDVVHGMPTIETGVDCDTMATPFLNACRYDAAGAILQKLHGDLQDRVSATEPLVSISQPGAAKATMLEEARLYVPRSCRNGQSCGIHVALHGCNQSSEMVGDAFARGAGYNEWAESNDLLVLYPQVGSSKAMPMNPLGCWDWWGYTSDEYASKNGAQIRVIKSMLDSLAGKVL